MDADFFEPDWPAMLHTAADGCGMRAVYQPIIDLTTGTVAGYEALIRFVGYPVRSPAPWLAAAHEHGRSAELQAAALRAALSERHTLPAGCFLTVNLGPDVLDTDPVQRVWQEHRDLHGLVIELTSPRPGEGDPRGLDPRAEGHTGTERSLAPLRVAGARIAVSQTDLGTLSGLHPDIVKLDTSHSAATVHATIGRAAGATLIAERIEGPADLDAAVALGVRLGQGYHLGRPARPWSAPSHRRSARSIMHIM